MMNTQVSRLHRGVALLIGLAGLIHLVITPQHWAHAPAHGILFVIAGVAELIWAVLVWRRPSSSLYTIGLIGAGGLVTLWVITRILPAPFGHGPEPVEPYGVVCKLAETLGAIVLAFLAFGQIATAANRAAARRAVVLWVVAALALGWGTYGVARAAEPFLPALAVSAEHQHEEHQHEMTPTGQEEGTATHEHQAEETTPESHEHQH